MYLVAIRFVLVDQSRFVGSFAAVNKLIIGSVERETRLLNRIHEGAESLSTHAYVADASSSRPRSAEA